MVVMLAAATGEMITQRGPKTDPRYRDEISRLAKRNATLSARLSINKPVFFMAGVLYYERRI